MALASKKKLFTALSVISFTATSLAFLALVNSNDSLVVRSGYEEAPNLQNRSESMDKKETSPPLLQNAVQGDANTSSLSGKGETGKGLAVQEPVRKAPMEPTREALKEPARMAARKAPNEQAPVREVLKGLEKHRRHPQGKADAAVVGRLCAAGYCLPRQLKSHEERKKHDKCLLEAVEYVENQKHLTNTNLTLSKCSCRLHSGRPRFGRVGLVSLPGSGNTWARGLLQQATGICTASMWCDPNLRATQFCGEGLHSGRTLLIKNHDPRVRWRGQPLPGLMGFSENNKPEFDAVILVHRDPYDAMVAEHNREVGHDLWEEAVAGKRAMASVSSSAHVRYFGPEYFGENLAWGKRVKELMTRWELMVTHLLVHGQQEGRSVLLVHYEDLKANATREVLRMVRFLGVEVPDDMVAERVKQDFTSFYRNHTQSFEHFTTVQKDYINRIILQVASKLNSQVLPLMSYLRT